MYLEGELQESYGRSARQRTNHDPKREQMLARALSRVPTDGWTFSSDALVSAARAAENQDRGLVAALTRSKPKR